MWSLNFWLSVTWRMNETTVGSTMSLLNTDTLIGLNVLLSCLQTYLLLHPIWIYIDGGLHEFIQLEKVHTDYNPNNYKKGRAWCRSSIQRIINTCKERHKKLQIHFSDKSQGLCTEPIPTCTKHKHTKKLGKDPFMMLFRVEGRLYTS